MSRRNSHWIYSELLHFIHFVCLVLYSSQHLWAVPVIENHGRFEIDWTNLKIRSHGQAKQKTSDPTAPYDAAQRAALDEGLTYLGRVLPEYLAKKNIGSKTEPNTFEASGYALARKTYIYATEIYQNRHVKLLLESSLTNAFPVIANNKEGFFQNKLETPQTIENTSVIFELNKAVQPRPFYEITNDEGKIVFSKAMIYGAAFSRNLMGRWHKKPVGENFHIFVGKRPLRIPITVASHGNLSVSTKEWSSLAPKVEALLRKSQIALLLPR